ncbi:hypothetical protein N8T08_000476 [Aspergillus melleus]|uniref:Uncharacterized protein n=1 Tax=Aspergillus melleus TaxID=138277 RepID=A0ACC3BBT8_9EURO|nr:hypothetical protein N8T08_000476 [Aspergillus melleus]
MALENEDSPSSVGERRGQRLAPLQTNFSRPTSRPLLVTSPRTQRPRPEEYQNDEEHNERVPLQPTPVKRQSSKSGLRGLFGREKTARKAPSDAKLSGIDEVQPSAPNGEPGPSAPLSPISTSTPVAVPSSATEPHRAKTPSKSRGRQSEDKPGSDDTAWKPPPLFQAFPQSIKHDTLPCPGLSVDSILRFHATSAAKRDEDHSAQNSNKGNGTDDPTVRKKKGEKEKRKHLRTLSDTIGKTEWAQKIYVLTTSGYILQYSGGGKHDRLPEKMLQLGPKSVAFASDAIPGKHWVLQVSQSSEEQPSTNTDTHRPLLSRFGFHRSHAKRLARSFLLVFHTPEDLSSWLLAVRAQIEARGGKKYVTERVFDDDMEHQLHSQTSARQLVRKDPNRFSQSFLQPQQSTTSDEQESTLTDQSRRSSHVSHHRRSLVMPPGPESRSESISTTHTEVTSPVSGNGQGRFYSAVPPGGVPMSPPKNEKSAISTVLSALDTSASPTLSTPRKRQSLNLQQAAATETPEIPRSQSVAPDPLLRSASPPAPNFSVPSFSQRFAARDGSTRLSRVPPSMRGNDMPVDPAEIMSTFSSPPQSPGKPPSNFGPGYGNEQQLPSHDTPRKPLRVSNSEDSLADPQRSQDTKPHRFSRIPKNDLTAAPPTTSHSSRPLSAIKNEAAESRINAPLPPLPPGATEPLAQKPNRTSVLHRADSGGRPAGPPMPRRKSMPGLTVGPPSVPPPNCPLPKIPSPVDPAAHDWPEPPTTDQRAGTPGRPSRKFRLSSMPHPPANGRTTPSGQRSASRQSRLPVK